MTVREYCRSARAVSSEWRTSCRWARRAATPPNATARSAARTRTRMRRPGRLTAGVATSRPPPATERDRARPSGYARPPARWCRPELASALLEPTRRAQRRHLDLELPDQGIQAAALGTQRIELVGQVHL